MVVFPPESLKWTFFLANCKNPKKCSEKYQAGYGDEGHTSSNTSCLRRDVILDVILQAAPHALEHICAFVSLTSYTFMVKNFPTDRISIAISKIKEFITEGLAQKKCFRLSRIYHVIEWNMTFDTYIIVTVPPCADPSVVFCSVLYCSID